MRWRRLAEAFPWRTAALLAGLAGSLWFLWWTWFALELSPLERYYWPTYFSSTEGAKHPGSKSRIDPLFLTAPGRKSEIVLAPDVARGETGDLPLQLSQSALERGWRGIEKGRPIWDDSAAIEDLLQDDFYAGQSFWLMTMEPLLGGCAYLLAWIVIAIVFVRQGLAAEWKELWTVLTEIDTTSNYHSDTPAKRYDMKRRIGSLWSRWNRLGESLLGPIQRAHQASRPTVVKRDLESIWDRIAADQLSVPPGMPPDTAPVLQLERPPISPPKKEAKQRFIFPGREGIRSANRKPKPWDESQWIG